MLSSLGPVVPTTRIVHVDDPSALAQEAGLSNTIGEKEECHNGKNAGGKTFDEESGRVSSQTAKKDVGKVYRIKQASTDTKASNLRKTAQLAGKEARRWQSRTNKSMKDVQARAKRSMREMISFWKRNERDERDQRKMAEKQELENAKRAEAEREANRQKRKLNFSKN